MFKRNLVRRIKGQEFERNLVTASVGVMKRMGQVFSLCWYYEQNRTGVQQKSYDCLCWCYRKKGTGFQPLLVL